MKKDRRVNPHPVGEVVKKVLVHVLRDRRRVFSLIAKGGEESKTNQSEKDGCDVNKFVAQHGGIQHVPSPDVPGVFKDVSTFGDTPCNTSF